MIDGEGDTHLVVAAAGEAVRTAEPADLVDYLEIVYPASQ